MNRHLFSVAFLLGALAVVWVGAGFIGSSLPALAMTAIIGAVYVSGAFELLRYRQATSSLAAVLAAVPEDLTDLGDWLTSIPASLQNTVRLRIEGERVGLPGPALTPYLVGLLVMLGMLGTFLGMVVTLNGAVFALEKTTDLQAIRSALSAPMVGLGLAFGTSVAGVATSAMLGLMSALSRRERVLAAQLLDTKIATVLRRFSLTHQRQETFRALQLQSQALPGVAEKLQTMMAHMESMSQQLNQRLLSNQEDFHSNVKTVYADLARAVDQSLRDSLRLSAQAAGDSIKPVVEAAMNGIAHDAKLMHERMAGTVQKQLDGLSERFNATAAAVTENWMTALTSHEQISAGIVTNVGRSLDAFNDAFEQRSGELVATIGAAYTSVQGAQAEREEQRQQAWARSLQAMSDELAGQMQHASAQMLSRQQEICSVLTQTAADITKQTQASASHMLAETTRLLTSTEELMRERIASEGRWTQQQRERMDQLAGALRAELSALREEECMRGHAAVERLGQLQSALTEHLTTLGAALEEPMTKLIKAASEAPRAAAEVIGQLRQEISNSAKRDNELLEERSRIMATLSGLLDAINHASTEQRAVIDSLVASSAAALDAAGRAFSDNVASESTRLSEIAAQVTSSAVDVSSLADTFGFAVNTFNESNDKLVANLQRIEAALDKSMHRGDEQLAYYVAQAREIIDLSTASQKEMVEALRRLPAKQAELAGEAG